MARHYTVSERAIMILGVKAGKSLPEINDTLMSEQLRQGATMRTLNESSYKMLRDKYIPSLDEKGIWTYIHKPQKLSELK